MHRSYLRLLVVMLVFLGVLSAILVVKRYPFFAGPKVTAPSKSAPVESRRESKPEPEIKDPFEATPDRPFPGPAKQEHEKRQTDGSDIKVELAITAADIKPRGLVPIPDDPPPHEGAMITLPYIVQPPDVLRVEILQAAPGRPVQGPRLVRPDGAISLDFYGNLDVAGLTMTQVKEKVVLHMRTFLTDNALGLYQNDERTGEPARDDKGKPVTIPPAESEYVFVDVDQYNSAVFYVQGDVGLPGRFPCTGKETALDALNFAGGFLSSAESRDITLARPARGESRPGC